MKKPKHPSIGNKHPATATIISNIKMPKVDHASTYSQTFNVSTPNYLERHYESSL